MKLSVAEGHFLVAVLQRIQGDTLPLTPADAPMLERIAKKARTAMIKNQRRVANQRQRREASRPEPFVFRRPGDPDQ